MLPKRMSLAATLLLSALPFVAQGVQDGAQPSQKLDPRIQRSSRRFQRIGFRDRGSSRARNTLSDPTQGPAESGRLDSGSSIRWQVTARACR
jgi:hypothetical protein